MTPSPLRDMLAPEADAAVRADEDAQRQQQQQARQDAANQREAARQQHAQEVENKKQRNAVAEADFRTRGVENYTDAYGDIQPVKEPDGTPRLKDRAGKTEWDKGTGGTSLEPDTRRRDAIKHSCKLVRGKEIPGGTRHLFGGISFRS